MKRLFCFCFFLSLTAKTVAQQPKDSTTTVFGGQFHYGFILPHSKEIVDISGSNPSGFTLEISRVRQTQEAWNICNCISQNGFSLSYYNYNYPEVLGSSWNLSLFTEPYLLTGRFNLALRAGAGLSYLTRIYHPQRNPKNLFFSRPFSGILSVQLNTRISLHGQWALRLGGSYNHISNGGTRQPNKGMNFPLVNIGIEHAVQPLMVHPRAKVRLTDRSLRYYAGFFTNTRAVDEGGDTQQRKIVLGLQAGFYKPFWHMHAAGLALEASHDGALKARARLSAQPYDHRIVSALARHHFLFGNFDFSQALGVYLHNQIPDHHEVFQRYALEYRIIKFLKAGFSLKAHLHVAEQIDLRATVIF